MGGRGGMEEEQEGVYKSEGKGLNANVKRNNV